MHLPAQSTFPDMSTKHLKHRFLEEDAHSRQQSMTLLVVSALVKSYYGLMLSQRY